MHDPAIIMRMIGILLQFLLLLQGIPTPANQGGAITGVLMSDAKTPAAGVRVAVMVPPESPGDVASAASLVSIAETDEAGRFSLENVPPGRYYITAGRVELPTYYPGTLDIGAGKIVTVAAGTTVSAVDFSMKDVSDRGVETVNAAVRIPLQIQFENASRLPVFSQRGKVDLRLTHIADGATAEVPLDAADATLPIATGDYHVDIENLPDGYSVKSMTYGSIDLMNSPLQVTLENLPAPVPGEKISLTPAQTGVLIQRRISSLSSLQPGQYLIPQTSSLIRILGSITSKTVLSISLSSSALPEPPGPGVHVRGRVENAGQQELYISGKPGTLFADGSFEFSGVLPGRHVVAMFGASAASRQRGAVLTVGNVDVDNLELQDIIVLPENILTLTAAVAGDASPDSLNASFHAIRGHVVEASTQHPVAGIVTLRGYGRSLTNSLPADGEFEIQNLLPGNYSLKIETFEPSTLVQSIVIGNADVDLKLSVP